MAAKKNMQTKTKILMAFGILGAVLLVVYLGFVIYFQNHFVFKTTINGMDVSGMSLPQVKHKIEAEINHYKLTLNGRKGLSETITGEQIGIAPDWEVSMENMLKEQNAFLWLGKLAKPDKFQSAMFVKYDESKLDTVLADLYCTQAAYQIAPEDARISEYKDGGYQLIPAEEGNVILTDKLKNAIIEAIGGLSEEINLEEKGCYTNPEIQDDNALLVKQLKQMNDYVGTVITYEVGDDRQVLDGSTIKDWIRIEENGDAVIDEAAVTNYVAALAKKYNTAFRKRTLMTSYGVEVVISPSYYGWKIDRVAEKDAILEEIASSAKVTRDLHYEMTANSHGKNDYGDSYVEINLTAQHLFVYKDGELVTESDFVSGDTSKGNGTPTGAYGLTYKKRDAVLRGEDYETPVTYWMPFNGNIGMHDATWRRVFGAAQYMRDGSHGCINLPKKQAEIIFGVVSKNYPVLVYELEGTQSDDGVAQTQAYDVIDAIAAIGTVTPESGPLITNARAAYDALSDRAKKYVTNYKKLTAAESDFADLS